MLCVQVQASGRPEGQGLADRGSAERGPDDGHVRCQGGREEREGGQERTAAVEEHCPRHQGQDPPHRLTRHFR